MDLPESSDFSFNWILMIKIHYSCFVGRGRIALEGPFAAVTAPYAEQEKDILFIWIQLEVEFHNGCQPVNPTPQICITGGKVKPPKSGCVIQHGGSSPARESSSTDAEFEISKIRFPFRITRSGRKTGDALSDDTAGSLISAKETVL